MVLPQGGRVGRRQPHIIAKSVLYPRQTFFLPFFLRTSISLLIFLLLGIKNENVMVATQRNLQIRLEIIWWIFTLVLVLGVLLPIWLNAPNFPFFIPNIIFIVGFVTLARYTFLLKHTFLARLQYIKLITMFLMIPLIFYLVSEIHDFQTYIDEKGWVAIFGAFDPGTMKPFASYIHTEYLLFGVGSITAAVVLVGRLIVSIWRVHNLATKV